MNLESKSKIKCFLRFLFTNKLYEVFHNLKKTKNDVRTFYLKLNIDQALDNK